MRMFVGIPLPPDLAAWLTHAMSRLPLHEEELRRSRPEGWHITLQFLGNVAPPEYECLVSRLGEISFNEARIHITRVGWIGTGILAAEIEPARELVQLAKDVTAATKLCGFQPEDRPWRPHVTLARRKRKARGNRASTAHVQSALAGLTSEKPPEASAREFFLYESFSDPEGQRYETRAQFPRENTGG